MSENEMTISEMMAICQAVKDSYVHLSVERQDRAAGDKGMMFESRATVTLYVQNNPFMKTQLSLKKFANGNTVLQKNQKDPDLETVLLAAIGRHTSPILPQAMKMSNDRISKILSANKSVDPERSHGSWDASIAAEVMDSLEKEFYPFAKRISECLTANVSDDEGAHNIGGQCYRVENNQWIPFKKDMGTSINEEMMNASAKAVDEAGIVFGRRISRQNNVTASALTPDQIKAAESARNTVGKIPRTRRGEQKSEEGSV